MKTAVELYNIKVIELMSQREQGNIDVLEFRNRLDLLFEQAKEIEKKQIIESYSSGYTDSSNKYRFNRDYYNTFNK